MISKVFSCFRSLMLGFIPTYVAILLVCIVAGALGGCQTVPVTEKAVDCTANLKPNLLTDSCKKPLTLQKGDHYDKALQQKGVNDNALVDCGDLFSAAQQALKYCHEAAQKINQEMK